MRAWVIAAAILLLVTGVAPARTAAFDARRLDVNRLRMWVANDGRFPADPATSNAGLLYPRASGLPIVYASGLWLGDSLDGGPRLALAEYVSEFSPGTAADGGPEHVVYKVSRWTGHPADTARVERSAFELAADATLDPLAHHSWSEYMRGAAPHGAPWRLHRLPDTSTPAAGDSVDVPGPDVTGDQMLWCVFHDANPASHTSPAGSTAPLGVEVRQAVMAWHRMGPFSGAALVRWDVVLRGDHDLPGLRAAFWADPDIGGDLHDDLSGCDTTRALGYAYNTSAAPDPDFGEAEPAVGFAWLAAGTASVPAPARLAAFADYVNGSDPANASETWNLLRGLKTNGLPWFDPVSGLPSPLPYSGDPVAGGGWLDGQPSNLKLLATLAPRALARGDTLTLWLALVVAQGETPIASAAVLQCAVDDARDAFAARFAEPFASPRPCATSLLEPPPPAFALSSAWPNPAREGWSVSFTLPSPGTARLELFDLAGRRVHDREVAGLRAGPGQAEVAPGLRPRPGLYFVRMSFGGERRTARIAAFD